MRFLILCLLLMSGCKGLGTKQENPPAPNPAATEAIGNVGRKLSEILPLSLNANKFNQLATTEAVDHEINDLSHFHHDRRSLKKRMGDDPTLQFLSGRFNDDMEEAHRQLNLGNRTYARHLIRSAASSCVSCHSEGGRGTNFLSQPTGPVYGSLNSLERANYLFAIGADDRALQLYFDSKSDGNEDSEREEVALKALGSAVTVKRDPALAQRIVDEIQTANWSPESLKLSAKAWSGAIRTWIAANKVAKTPSVADAKLLLATAAKKQAQSPSQRAGLIETLRASAELEDVIKQPLRSKYYPEALYLKGLAANATHDLNPFSLNNAYFEACVSYAPHSKSATNCYLKFETSVLSANRDLDAGPLPEVLRSRLRALRQTAVPSESPILEWGQQHD